MSGPSAFVSSSVVCRAGVLVALVASLMGCSNIEGAIDRVLPREGTQYETSGSRAPLEVPPGLSSTTIKDAYPVGGKSSATYSELIEGKNGAVGTNTAALGVLPVVADARVGRNGDERWLVVDAQPGIIWPKLREFWLKNGFLISQDDPAIGIMETAWAEKREDLPVGMIQRLLSKVNTAAYSFATRDRFRVRLERGTEQGTTEIYVSHRGAEEKSQGDSFVWVPRPADPEIEAEMLNRMMLVLGVPRETADRLIAQHAPREERASMLTDANGVPVLALREDFSRAWRRTGLALDRVGFTVEDRDRSRGLFYVRYVDPLADSKKTDNGWVNKLKFWGDDSKPPDENEFLISLVGGDTSTQVLVLDKQGHRDHSGTGERILSLLHEQLK
jgi:outer membrane protein assembly factor BamC